MFLQINRQSENPAEKFHKNFIPFSQAGANSTRFLLRIASKNSDTPWSDENKQLPNYTK